MINPTAMLMWIILACIGWLVNDTTGAVIGLLVGASISWLVDVINGIINR